MQEEDKFQNTFWHDGKTVNFFDVVTNGWHARYAYWQLDDSVTERPVSAITPTYLPNYLQRSVRFIVSLSSAAVSHIASSNSSAHPAADVFKGHDKTDTVEHSLSLSLKTLLLLYSLTYIQLYIQWAQNLVKVTV